MQGCCIILHLFWLDEANKLVSECVAAHVKTTLRLFESILKYLEAPLRGSKLNVKHHSKEIDTSMKFDESQVEV